MKTRPILFSGPMVRAILAGKTQTRRESQFSDIYRLTDERITAIHSNDEYEIATKTDSGISKRRLPSGERRKDLLPDALRWIWTQGARGLVCVEWPQQREGIPHCFFVPQQQENNKGGASSGLYGVSWYATNSDAPNQTLEREQAGQPSRKPDMGDTGGELERPPRAWHCNGWGEALGIKIIRRGTGSYSLRRNNGSMFPAPRRTSIGDVTICHFRNLPWIPKTKLWVRETFAENDNGRFYRADGDEFLDADGGLFSGPWKPSIFMPRSASRITLETTAVRVERLQEITEDDAKAEGADRGYWDKTNMVFHKPCHEGDESLFRSGYGFIWDSINGHGSWDKNPWVWVIEFKRI